MTDDLTRRAILRGLGGMLLGSVPACAGEDLLQQEEAAERDTRDLAGVALRSAAPNVPLTIPNVQGYAQSSVVAGSDSVELHVSSPYPYELTILRLGWNTDAPVGDTIVAGPLSVASAVQTIHPGSYVHVERSFPAERAFAAMTLECWIRPLRNPRNPRWQGLITQYCDPDRCGFGLFLTEDDRVAAYFGDGGTFAESFLFRSAPAPSLRGDRNWHHVAATVANGIVTIYIDGVAQTGTTRAAAVGPGLAPLRLGAHGVEGFTSGFLDGDIAMPAIYSRALGAEELATRAGRAPTIPEGASVEACWPLAEERGSSVADASLSARHGIIVNHGTWMIGGPGYVLDERFRHEPYDPASDARRGHALRLASDDLYDCGWPVTSTIPIAEAERSGIHVARLVYEGGRRYDIPFIVRRSPRRTPAPLLVIAATNTWHAYKTPFVDTFPDSVPFGPFGLYRDHAAGQPTYSTGFRMPWGGVRSGGHEIGSGVDPYALLPSPHWPDGSWASASYGHLLRAERDYHVWLEQNGYDFDVIADADLHWHPELLDDHAIVSIAGHSEYWTAESYAALRAYLDRGGSLLSLSGNTMFWRVSYDDDRLECRKYPPSVGGSGNARLGETFHEQDGKRGGLMREAGAPAWQITGLEFAGFDLFASYRVANPSHTFFTHPERLEVTEGSVLGGDFAAGHEWDVRLQTIPGEVSPAVPTSYRPVLLASADGSFARNGPSRYFDYRLQAVFPAAPVVVSEIVEYTTPGGGRVLSVGSIASGHGMRADPALGGMVRNAMHHMGVGFGLEAVATGADGGLFRVSYRDAAWLDGREEPADLASAPAGFTWAAGQVAFAAVTRSGELVIHRYPHAGAPPIVESLGRGFQGPPAAIVIARDEVAIVARQHDGAVVWNRRTRTGWSGWTPLGAVVQADVAAVAWGERHVAVASVDADGHAIYKHLFRTGERWNERAWIDLGGSFAGAPTLVARGGDGLTLFAARSDGSVAARTWDDVTGSPADWEELGERFVGGTSAAAWGQDQLSVLGVRADGTLVARAWDGSAWGPSTPLGEGCAGRPAVTALRGRQLSVVVRSSTGGLRARSWDGKRWQDWRHLGGPVRSDPFVFAWHTQAGGDDG